MDNLILIGAGGHAKACIDIIEQNNTYKIAGIINNDTSSQVIELGYKIIGTDNDLENLRNEFDCALIAIGQIKTSKIRMELYELLKSLHFKLPIIESPLSYVSQHAQIGEGTIIMHGAIINANATIGKNCIINNKSLIEHDVIIGDHCHISTGAILNGGVSVGNGSFIGSGVITKQSISIGNNCIVGAGSVLKYDIDSNKIIK